MEHGSGEEVALVEVYEYPQDCVASELSYHFSKEPFSAQCKTQIDKMFNYKSSTFVLEFSPAEALRILEHPIQYLDEDDALSMIKINGLDDHQGKQVMVTCEYELSTRMVKNFFRKFGELESCQPYGYGQCRFVLTFTKKNAAEKIVAEEQHKIGPMVTVKTEFFKKAMERADNLPSPASTSLSLKFDFDSASVIDTKSEYGALSAAKDNVSIVESDQLDGLSGLMIGELVSSSESELCLSTMDQESITQTEGTDSHIYESIEINSNQASASTRGLSSSTASSIPLPPPLPLPSLPPPVTQDNTLLYKPGVDLRNCVQIKNCVVRLVLGDISEHPADVLVNSKGMAGFAISKKAVKGKVKDIGGIDASPYGSILVTSSTNIAAKYIFSFRFQDTGQVVPSLHSHQSLVKLCLHQSDVLCARSVAFPALGTGLYGEAPSMMANMIIDAIMGYLDTQARSVLELIDLVIYQNQMIPIYSKAMNKAVASTRTTSFRKTFHKKGQTTLENVYQIPK